MSSRFFSIAEGPMPFTSASSSADLKGPNLRRYSTMASARFAPIPFSSRDKVLASAVLMLTGPARASADQALHSAYRSRAHEVARKRVMWASIDRCDRSGRGGRLGSVMEHRSPVIGCRQGQNARVLSRLVADG